ncbi:MAG TPA: class I SAM-dependent methyltransferase [Longimicrobiales bacterium]|nr:class I SAM-dependent methyltransferase [Longimicrobiales bacterium]
MDADVFRVHADVEQRHWWFAARRAILRSIVEAVVPANGSKNVVDVGCGVGANATAFHPDYRCIGYDPSPDAIAFARSAHPGVDFHTGGAAEAQTDLAAADAVLLTDVIEHVPDDHELLSAVIGPLKPDAFLLVTVPAGMELWSPHDVALGHHRRYDPGMLANAWRGLPVTPVLVSHFNSRLYPAVRAVRWITSRLKRSAGGEGTDLALPPAAANVALQRVFVGEAERLRNALASKDRPYSRGVSLMALLRRTGSTS